MRKNQAMPNKIITVIGAGLAGVEAANTLANSNYRVRLIDMKPRKKSPAHTYDGFAELVCSNSLKAIRPNSAAGMLKEEMRILGSIVMEAADKTAVPAGGALAVDREGFSNYITKKIRANPLIEILSEEVTEFPTGDTIIATGPLTSDAFAAKIAERCGDGLSFFDAAAPIVTADSIDMDKVYFATRYDKGDADYINCPMSKEEYEKFYQELVNAESAPQHVFENINVYEGCMPVEVLAKRGIESVRYGCMKPVGLIDPRTNKRPYAVVQLRKENSSGSMYNLVGFQTNLRFGEQKRVFGMIPGLLQAEFVRYGVMHRNTFIDSPRLLGSDFLLNGSDGIYFAGQITGVEGYTESAASGIVAAKQLIRRLNGESPLVLPVTTMIGALCHYISDKSVQDFQPMGANIGILPPLDMVIKNKQERYAAFYERGVADLLAAIGGNFI